MRDPKILISDYFFLMWDKIIFAPIMSYLIANDFNVLIQPANLAQVLGGNTVILDQAIAAAQETAIESLSQKFMIDEELVDLDEYNPTATYSPGQRVYLDADAFSATETYALGVLVLYNGSVYVCSTAVTVAAAWNASDWTLLGVQYAIYYISIPYQVFDIYKLYPTGTIVYWKGNKYTCQIASMIPDHQVSLQLQYYSNIPPPNVFPDDPNNGVKYWGTPVPLTVGPGTFPDGYTAGDTRNQTLVRHLVAIALYIVHNRMAPQNVPRHIVVLYRGDEGHGVATKDGYIYPDYSALGWLQSASLGMKPIRLPVKQPRQGGRIAWGSKVRNQNGY